MKDLFQDVTSPRRTYRHWDWMTNLAVILFWLLEVATIALMAGMAWYWAFGGDL